MSKLTRWLLEPEPPGLGLDLRANELSLARLSEKRGRAELDLCVTSPLPPGTLHLDMLEPNIRDADTLAQVIESVLLRSGAAGSKRIALTLPDYLSRVSIVELPEAPRSSAETIEVLKFRLKKSLPFDAGDARVAYESLGGNPPSYLTGVMHETVVGQYEDFLSDLGFRVGLVLPASVSLLGVLRPLADKNLSPGADYFFVNVEREYFTVSLVRDRGAPVLMRTLGLRATEGPPAAYTEEDLLQDIIPTAIYYREKLKGSSLERVYYRSLRPDLVHLREILEGQFEAPSEPFNLTSAIAVASDLQLDAALADSVGAAAGAAFGKVA
jgi:type IV pilus assembly protein PilM